MKINEIIKKFSKLIKTIYFFITLFVLYTGYRTFLTSGYYVILFIGFALFVPVLVYLYNSLIKCKKREGQFKKNREEFKKTARRVLVNLDDVEIKSNEWNEQIVIDNSKYGGLNQMTGNSDKNIENVHRTINNVKIVIPINGKNRTIQFNIEMNTDSLRIKFAIKKETTYYYDINNPEMDFLDLDFLFD